MTNAELQDADTALSRVRRNGFAGAIGNVMEWYDFAAYAFIAPFISQLFFPSDDDFTSLLATYGAFAAGYLARPLGAVAFGYIGDKMGRKQVLVLSVWMMGIASVLIGFLPDVSTIGPSAALLLIGLRVVQGFSVGGEYTGSTTFVIEHAPAEKRAFYCSWILCGGVGGFLLGSAVTTLMTNTLDQAAIENWAWRLPFLSGALITVVAIYLRRNLEEPPAPTYEEEWDRSPIVEVFVNHWRDLLRVMGLVLAVNVTFYMMYVYAISYLTDRMHVSSRNAMDINTICMAVLTFLPLLTSLVSDRIGRKPLLLTGTISLLFLAWPFFWLMHHQNLMVIFFGQLGFALVLSWINGANPATMAEILPRRVRVSVLSIGYNLCLSIFGGTTPFVAAYLVERTGDDFTPVYYLMGLTVLSLITVFTIPETHGKPLRD
ncbi:MAG: MFS transporter [Stappiaceae bacterium]